MSNADAELAYTTLKDSKETVTSDPTLSQNAGAQKLAALSDKIAQAEGGTDAEKMKAFLRNSN